MAKKFTILTADRNRNVREFLKREMIAEGYRVKVAKIGVSQSSVLSGYYRICGKKRKQR